MIVRCIPVKAQSNDWRYAVLFLQTESSFDNLGRLAFGLWRVAPRGVHADQIPGLAQVGEQVGPIVGGGVGVIAWDQPGDAHLWTVDGSRGNGGRFGRGKRRSACPTCECGKRQCQKANKDAPHFVFLCAT
jgi:hypothetical protein